MKYLVVLFLFVSSAYASITIRWMSAASVLIEDGQSSILFDPAYTRPNWKHWLGLSEYKSDEEVVSRILANNSITKLDAIFIAHSHFDHVTDAPTVATKTGAMIYGDESVARVARAYNKDRTDLKTISNGVEVVIGQFKVTAYERTHSPLLNWFDFLPGSVPKDFSFGFYDYKAGHNWFFVVEHPEAKILIDNSQEAPMEEMAALKTKLPTLDVLIQGITNKNLAIVEDGYVKNLNPRYFIPIHFDYFMSELKWNEEAKELPTVDLEKLKDLIGKKTQFVKPKYGEKILIK